MVYHYSDLYHNIQIVLKNLGILLKNLNYRIEDVTVFDHNSYKDGILLDALTKVYNPFSSRVERVFPDTFMKNCISKFKYQLLINDSICFISTLERILLQEAIKTFDINESVFDIKD